MSTESAVGWVSVKQFLDKHSGLVGRSKIYGLIESGEIDSVRIGRKVLIREDVIDQLYESQKSGGNNGDGRA
jgi:excisionase family DNA binding protein